ncbi:Asp-tRNA(Asn)/Glu-tRNA(Gln) amidotransferase subunit GatA [Candidatus Uabimicrobium sp. HlEnr_7]|uniref:Asp-tRNA(Asn)/Glu-tRNA(Gln) amidotransferase subunit GatA n=1 Tax=Candidatus Uabimicrobium helgolandensis TaxID=3095367 RepID=UPI003558471A
MVSRGLAQLNLKQLTTLLKKREISCEEILLAHLDVIEKYDSCLGAFLQCGGRKDLVALAQESDKRWGNGENISLLDGIFVAVKDNIHVDGFLTTCASRILNNYRPPYEATCIEKLRQSGAVVLGKTNLDEFAMGSTTENSATVTSNPWNVDHVAGGSSGGSAVAVCSGMSSLALGSDTGGSIRQPASFCGLVGLKPSYGRVSRYGLVAHASSLDQIGPITKDVYSAAQLLNVISGFDNKDSTSVCSDRIILDELQRDISGKKVAVLGKISSVVDPQVALCFDRAQKTLKELGVIIEEIEFPAFDYVVAAYYLISTAEASSNLARYDGVKYGVRQECKNYQQMLTATRSQAFGKEVKKRILLGNFVLSSGYYDAYYQKAQKARGYICDLLKDIFNKYDAIITPTTPTTAFKKGENEQDFMKTYTADITTVVASLAGIPAISLPCGLVDGLPVGLQIMGKMLEEQQILNIAYQFEKAVARDFSPPLGKMTR